MRPVRKKNAYWGNPVGASALFEIKFHNGLYNLVLVHINMLYHIVQHNSK
jgi:hypothetical protein